MFPEGRALEFLLAAVVALVVVGPKDLPVLMRKLGQFIGRVRAMAAEFRASFDEMARQSELDELRKEVEAMRRAQLADVAADTGQAEIRDAFDGIRQELNDAGANLNEPPPPYYATHSEVEPAPAPKPRARRKPAAAKAAQPRKAASKPRAKKKPEAEA